MENKRIEYITLASVLSAIAVVFLHTNEYVLYFAETGGNLNWFLANFVHSICFPAVPIFFMISGAMLFNFHKKYDLKTFFIKRITKTVIPYVIWSLFGLIFSIYFLKTISIDNVNLKYILLGLINGNIVGPYWFFTLLFMFYCLIPLFSRIISNKKYCQYCMIILLIITLLFAHDSYSKIAIVGYLFFGMFGYYIHEYGISMNFKRCLYILGVLGLLFHLFGTYYLSLLSGQYVDLFKSYTHITCICYSVGLFTFMKYDLVRIMEFSRFNKLISFLDFYTFGIYLIHWYIIKILIKLLNINISSVCYRLLSPFFIIMCCICIIYLMRKIPLLKNIVP